GKNNKINTKHIIREGKGHESCPKSQSKNKFIAFEGIRNAEGGVKTNKRCCLLFKKKTIKGKNNKINTKHRIREGKGHESCPKSQSKNKFIAFEGIRNAEGGVKTNKRCCLLFKKKKRSKVKITK
ncbi:hypothetical protein Tsubulata_050887, partial [Turnera subulata]